MWISVGMSMAMFSLACCCCRRRCWLGGLFASTKFKSNALSAHKSNTDGFLYQPHKNIYASILYANEQKKTNFHTNLIARAQSQVAAIRFWTNRDAFN